MQTLQALNMKKLKIVFVIVIAIAGVAASVLIRHRAKTELSENDAVLLRQDDQLAALRAEHQRLSDLVAVANNRSAMDHTAELTKLRSAADVLRKQTNELGKQLAENTRSRPWQTALETESSTNFFALAREVVSDSNSEEYKERLYRMASAAPHTFPSDNNRAMDDARNLSWAVRKYARDHQDEFPTNFDQAAAYFYKESPAPQTSEFELVYQGSRKELSNVPEQAIALIRERQSWQTPGGKWARIYVMAGGDVKVVESDDNFL